MALLRLSMRRVVLLSVVTSGLYLLYWFYLTWKHLQSETQEVHYPAWYTFILILFVPFYWLFCLPEHVRTWKHLQSETREVHYPIWHALSLFVPVYGLFRLHKHVSVIQKLALGAGVETSLAPGLAVVLVALNGVLGMGSARIESVAGLVLLNIISLALTATLIAWSQDTLNRYWGRAKGTALWDAPIGVGERVLVLLGILLWVNVSLTVL